VSAGPRVGRFLPPLIASLAGYRPGWIGPDLAAGLAVAAVGLPSAIAYPAIAGLPPETGLYASIAAAFGYALFGPSRKLIVGPDAATMTILAASLAVVVAAIPDAGPADRLAAASAIAVLAGLACLGARLVGLGALANFLSRPILAGFFAGISLSIMIGQIGRVTGLAIEAKGLVAPLVETLREVGQVHWPSLALAVAMFALLQAARVLRSPVPGPVIVVVLAVALSAVFDFAGRGIATVGAVPVGLPGLSLPAFAALPLREIVTGAAAVFLVAFGSGMVTARSFGAREGYRVDPNRELGGLGAANLAAGLFGAFPVTASDSRTAINLSVGGRTQVAGVASGLALIVTLLWLNPALELLPVPALGAILIAAGIGMIDVEALREVRRISRAEFLFAMIALGGAVSFGVLDGIVISVGATLAHVLYRTMRPRVALLGRIPGQDGFHKLHRNRRARAEPGMMVAVIEGNLLFYNADAVGQSLRALADAQDPPPTWIVLDAGAMAQIDVTGAIELREEAERLAAAGVRLGLAGAHAGARRMLKRAGVVQRIGGGMVFATLEDALRAYRIETTSARDARAAEALGGGS
jgi:SulP family sulfate permease